MPPREDPGFEAAAAKALLEAARDGVTGDAEQATGYYWGDAKLHPYVRLILERAQEEAEDLFREEMTDVMREVTLLSVARDGRIAPLATFPLNSR